MMISLASRKNFYVCRSAQAKRIFWNGFQSQGLACFCLDRLLLEVCTYFVRREEMRLLMGEVALGKQQPKFRQQIDHMSFDQRTFLGTVQMQFSPSSINFRTCPGGPSGTLSPPVIRQNCNWHRSNRYSMNIVLV